MNTSDKSYEDDIFRQPNLASEGNSLKNEIYGSW